MINFNNNRFDWAMVRLDAHFTPATADVILQTAQLYASQQLRMSPEIDRQTLELMIALYIDNVVAENLDFSIAKFN